MRVTLSRNTFSKKENDFIGLLYVVMCSMCTVHLCVVHFVHRVADERSWYTLDSANSTVTA